MSAIFGGGGKIKKPAATGLQIQTSSNAVPVPIVWGQSKIAPNIIQYVEFKARKVKTGGKGGGSPKSYAYSATILLGMCEGPIDDINNVWSDLYKKQVYSLFQSKNASVEFLGSYSQDAWSYMVTKFPNEALAYRGVAYIAIPNYDMGLQPTVPQHNIEVNGLLFQTAVNSTLPDADPALLVEDFLTNVNYGTPFRADAIDDDTLFSGPNATTTGDSAYQTYCRAMGWGLSPSLVDSEPASKILERWLRLTNTAPVWSGDKLKFIPYGDEDITANGVTFLAPTDIQYDLTMDDFLYDEGEDPVQFDRRDPTDVKNAYFVEVMDRANDYNAKPVPARDQASIETYGLKQAPVVKAHEIKTIQMGDTVAHLILQRDNYVVNNYRFRLGQRFVRLEAMDCVTLTVPLMGLNQYRVRVVEVEENEDGSFNLIAEDFPDGVGTTSTYPAEAAGGPVYNSDADPGDIETPIIFEPPVQLTVGVPQVWIGATGTDEFWGGCEVWFSTDDTNFYKIGEITNEVRMGQLTAGLSAYMGANPDTTHTVSVSLADSQGELDSADATDAANGLTASLVGDEILAYEDATPTGTFAYDLDNLWRGLYGTVAAAVLTGTRFLRLDSNVFKFNLDPAYIGSTVYFKFLSFNSWGQNTQELSDVSSYSYNVAGSAFAISPPTNLVATGGDGVAELTWSPSPSGLVTGYRIYAVNDHSSSFGMATVVGEVAAGLTFFTHSGLLPDSLWRYWVTAFNAEDESTEEGPEDVTVNSASSSGGFFAGASGALTNNAAAGLFATAGIVIRPDVDIEVTHVWAWIDPPATTADYYAQISSISSITFDATDVKRVTAVTVNAVLATSNTISNVGSTNMRLVRIDFATPVQLTGGTNYLITVTYDQASGTAASGVAAASSGGNTSFYMNMPGQTFMGAPQFNTVGLSSSQAASAVPDAYYQIAIEGNII